MSTQLVYRINYLQLKKKKRTYGLGRIEPGYNLTQIQKYFYNITYKNLAHHNLVKRVRLDLRFVFVCQFESLFKMTTLLYIIN